jgi:hypothetical protein
VLYLPALSAPSVDAPTLETQILFQGHGETVLVAEDDLATREALVDSLELLGYQVLTAENGREALAVWQQHRDEGPPECVKHFETTPRKKLKSNVPTGIAGGFVDPDRFRRRGCLRRTLNEALRVGGVGDL